MTSSCTVGEYVFAPTTRTFAQETVLGQEENFSCLPHTYTTFSKDRRA